MSEQQYERILRNAMDMRLQWEALLRPEGLTNVVDEVVVLFEEWWMAYDLAQWAERKGHERLPEWRSSVVETVMAYGRLTNTACTLRAEGVRLVPLDLRVRFVAVVGGSSLRFGEALLREGNGRVVHAGYRTRSLDHFTDEYGRLKQLGWAPLQFLEGEPPLAREAALVHPTIGGADVTFGPRLEQV